MTALSAREHSCMALIAAFDLIEKRPPSRREIMKVLGLKELTQVERLIASLMRKGLIGRTGSRTNLSRAGGLQISQVKSPQENINAA